MRQKKSPDFNKLLKGAPLTEEYFIKQYCGDWLATGLHRKVFVFKPDDRFVVKMEIGYKEFANIGEWRNWEWNKAWEKFSQWLAPCEWISDDGIFLIQRRVQRIIDGGSNKYPKKIPALLTDTKYFNFGWLDGRLVCCDYPNLISTDFRMKQAKWWGKKI